MLNKHKQIITSKKSYLLIINHDRSFNERLKKNR